jgi:mRNA-degrading endonuclease RelE of RelBE toxin-antitoxin system
MTISFIETAGFTQALPQFFEDDDAYRLFQEALLASPDRGDVIPGCGGLRKVRWRDPRRGKGSRGGLRILYLHVPDARVILLLRVYDKDRIDDLTDSQREALAAQAERFKGEMLRRA